MATKREEIVDWLRDAYGMERGLEVTLEKQSENEDVHPSVRERARIHLDETRRHAQRVENCLEALGGEAPSAIKTGIGRTMEAVKGMGTAFAKDERVKDFLAAHGAEFFEVACYRSLIAAAEVAGEEGIVEPLRQNLKEDEAMARWLDDNVAGVTRDYLNKVAA